MPHRLLMCRPSAYDLRYEINDWMHLDNKPNRDLAARQWEELYAVLAGKLQAQVTLIEQAPDCPDMVFTANAGLMHGRQAIISRFKHVERQGEEPYFRKFFEEAGFSTAELKIEGEAEGPAFEGEGDALRAGKFMVLGYGPRTDLKAHERLKTLLSAETLSLELVDGRWYHLDTCFLPLGPESVAFYPAAFSEASIQLIRKYFKTIEIDPEEALRFACNAVVLDRSIVLPANCPRLVAELKRKSFDVYSVPMTEFIKTGGACKCLTLYLPDE